MATETKKVKMLSLREVAQRTGAAPSSIRLWVRQGRFPNAKLEESLIGEKFWLVPETDLKDLKVKPAGRPQGSKNKKPTKKK